MTAITRQCAAEEAISLASSLVSQASSALSFAFSLFSLTEGSGGTCLCTSCLCTGFGGNISADDCRSSFCGEEDCVDFHIDKTVVVIFGKFTFYGQGFTSSPENIYLKFRIVHPYWQVFLVFQK